MYGTLPTLCIKNMIQPLTLSMTRLLRILILNLLTWRIWLAPNNESKGHMGFKSGFKGVKHVITYSLGLYTVPANNLH